MGCVVTTAAGTLKVTGGAIATAVGTGAVVESMQGSRDGCVCE